MISISPLDCIEDIKKLYLQNSVLFEQGCSAVVAKDIDALIGYCLYRLTETEINIKYLYPTDDIMLADGILRSALHVADFRGIKKAYYSETVSEAVLDKLGFIDNISEKTLDINKLHETCPSCRK